MRFIILMPRVLNKITMKWKCMNNDNNNAEGTEIKTKSHVRTLVTPPFLYLVPLLPIILLLFPFGFSFLGSSFI